MTEKTAEEKVGAAMAKRPKMGTGAIVKGILDRAKPQIVAALPKHMTPDRMIKIAMGAIFRNKALLACDPMSLAAAVVEASELGLEPSGILGHAYLVPYYNKQTGLKEAQLQIGYKGFIELAARSGRISTITAEVVYEGDEFDYMLGTERFIKHKPKMRKAGEKLTAVCAYAVANYKDGGTDFEICSLDKIAAAKNNSKNMGGIWGKYWEEMARKTAIRRLAKRLPMSSELQERAVSDELREVGMHNSIEADFVVEEETDKCQE